MTILTRTGLRAALVALAALAGTWSTAHAQLTPAGTSIQNRATVNYSVGGQAQEVINSSPTGNTTPGATAGANTSFLVDNRVDLTVNELSTNATVTTPGASNAWLAFTVTNTGNAPQGYQLTMSEEVATTLFLGTDNANFGLANLQIRVDNDPSAGSGTGNDTFDAADTATAIAVLNPGFSITVFVVSPTVPLALLNGNFANVALQARTAVVGAATLVTETVGVNDPTAIEIVFADGGDDATESATDQFAIQSAALTVTKTQEVIDDGFSSVNPRAIPDAVVEYTITIANTGTLVAQGIAISDPVPASTTFETASAVVITGGSLATCIAEPLPDATTDGCFLDGTGNLVVGSAALGDIAAGGSATVRFQVRIN